jgi:hypothetical protein
MSYCHFRDEKPNARKQHRCYLCGLDIAKGETYLRRTGIGDDGVESFCMHVDCEQVTNSWCQDCWENHDEVEFREEKKQYYAKKDTENKERLENLGFGGAK